MFRLSTLAADYYTLKAKMQRARRLYVLACRKAIQAEGTPALERCARRLMFSGLKKTVSLADAEYTVLRNLYFIDLKMPYTNGKDRDYLGWHRWLAENKWEHSTQRAVHWIRVAPAVSAGYSVGQRVRINRPNSREHGKKGTIGSVSGLVMVKLDFGPPWRGLYESSELEAL